MNDSDLQRLFRAAAKVKEEVPASPPFGFDTRVIALSRQNGNGTMFQLRQMIARVAVAASAVIVLAAAGAYVQYSRTDNLEPYANEFAIADNAIQDEVGQ